MSLKPIVWKNFLFRFFLDFRYQVLLVEDPMRQYRRKCTNLNGFKELVMTILALIRIFRIKNKLIFVFCPHLTLFCKRKTYFELLHISRSSFGPIIEPIHFFRFVANGFRDFENNCFRTTQNFFLFFHFFLLYCQLFILSH